MEDVTIRVSLFVTMNYFQYSFQYFYCKNLYAFLVTDLPFVKTATYQFKFRP